jgi:hypothetical protein
MSEESPPQMLISEPITPEPGSFATDLMHLGLAALPGAFTWRGRRYEITDCLDHVKGSRSENHAGGEKYLRRQTFRVVLDTGQIAVIYVMRRVAAGSSGKKRWFLYSITSE